MEVQPREAAGSLRFQVQRHRTNQCPLAVTKTGTHYNREQQYGYGKNSFIRTGEKSSQIKAAASKAGKKKKFKKKEKRKNKRLLLSAGLGSAAGPGPAFSLSLCLVLDLGAALLKPDAPPPASHMFDWQLVTTAGR